MSNVSPVEKSVMRLQNELAPGEAHSWFNTGILTEERGWFSLQSEWIVFGEDGQWLMECVCVWGHAGGERIVDFFFFVAVKNYTKERWMEGDKDDELYMKITSSERILWIFSAYFFWITVPCTLNTHIPLPLSADIIWAQNKIPGWHCSQKNIWQVLLDLVERLNLGQQLAQERLERENARGMGELNLIQGKIDSWNIILMLMFVKDTLSCVFPWSQEQAI